MSGEILDEGDFSVGTEVECIEPEAVVVGQVTKVDVLVIVTILS